ncbi:uncharacterized protein DSM5745_00614 [Aspergillus mulundensis]|uniref:Chromosome segregation ATPase family protein n=1 Tax=Aspergillus mulundensis TaxID=1810919 RepID=A0A3D8T404_9EURO|nr:Uncharacterized protein DSM5745_00614 [Aspergillus mulundensis]RDW93292.1 Uncharacterized protein DSM5745_00614 [Aspergillus mulundensis]
MSHNREGSRDRELVLHRHQTVPMWDSSDPERAPPPLPMNPGSTSPITKGNVSPGIQAVAANFTEKMRENSPSPYTTNPMTPKSPEKSLIKGQFHKRMQSLQNTDTRSEFLNYLESRSPERPLRASFSEQSSKPPEKAVKAETPPDQQSSEELPNLLISNRYLSRPLFGESTPPSATMLALQNMQLPPEEAPRASGPESSSEPKSSQPNSFDFLSNQILSLTDIASSLQREMAQLSRRSKDNATDLISLKAATNARDEDIRKSLRDLSSNLAAKFLDSDAATRWDLSALLGSENAINQTEPDSSPNSKKSYSVPRMHSPNPYPMEREFCASPGPMTDGTANIALLEKVLREMATKEGQEKLLELMDELKSRPASDDSSKNVDNSMTEMLEEILNIVKQASGAGALVRSVNPEQDTEHDMEVIRQQQTAVTDEMLEIMKRVRSSVIEGGGMTNEVKHLVRELRGEVLGMGRNIASRLEDAERSRAIEDTPKGPGPEEIAQIVEDSLQELRDQLAAIMDENKQHSAALGEFRAAMDSAQISSVVKKALDECGMAELRERPEGARMEKDDILEAVREAWETYKPEIELQNFGLERDEILECLSEGLKAYQPQHEQAATYDQVLAAVQAGVQQFEQPPAITREEIIQVINESIENAEPRSLDGEQLAALRDEILNAVTESITTQTTLKKDEIIQGIQGSLENAEPRSLDGEQLAALRDEILNAVSESITTQTALTKDEIVEGIKGCLEAAQNRSLDEGQLAAIRDEVLHAVTESMTSQSALTRDSFDSGLGRDEILSAVSDGIEAHMLAAKELNHAGITKEDVTNIVNQAFSAQQSALTTTDTPPVPSRDEILQAIAEGLESQNSIPREIELNKEDLMEAITAGLNEVTANANQGLTDQILERLQEQLESLKEEVKQRPAATDANLEEILNTIKDSIALVRQDVEGFATTASDASGKYEILDTVKEGFRLLQADLEKTITENALVAHAGGNPDTPELLDAMEKEFEHLRQTLSSVLRSNPASHKEEILDAIRDISENHKPANQENVAEVIQREFESIRESLTMSLVPAGPKSDKEEIVAAVQATLDAFHEKSHARDVPDKDEILAAIQATMETFHEENSQARDAPVPDKDEIIAAVQAAMETLHEKARETPASDKDEIIAAVQATIEAFHEKSQPKDVAAFDKDEIIAAIQATMETFHEKGETKETPVVDKDEIIAAVQATMEAFHEKSQPKDFPVLDKDEIIAAVQVTMETFHEEKAQGKEVPDKDEIISAVRATLETFHDEKVQSAEPKSDKDDIVAAMRATLEAFHEEKEQAKDPLDKDDIIAAIRATLESFHEEKNQALVPAEPKNDTDNIAAAVRAALETFHEEKGQTKEPLDKDDILAAVQASLETFHEEKGQAKDSVDKDDIIAAIQATLEAFHEEKGKAEDGVEKEEILSAIREILESHKASSDENISGIVKQEFENLRDSLTMSLVPAELKNDKDDILAAVHAALESFHAEKSEAKDGAESLSTTELRDAFHDGVGIIKEDLTKLLERPADHSELLETLKEGLSGLKAELETMRQAQAELQENESSRGKELMIANEASKTNDLEGLKALISQIQTKVDAIEAAPRTPDLPEDMLKKEHMEEVLLGLHELQSSVTEIASREKPADDTTAKKEDTDVIETLLRNTKSQLDEMVFPAPDEIARAEQLGSLEEMVKETKDVVAEIYGRLEAEVPTKAEIGTLETLLKDMWIALDESKPKEGEKEGEEDAEKEGEKEAETDTEKLVKSDLQTVEAMIFEVKTQVEELKLPDIETLPTKSEIQDIAALVTEFKEKVEADQELTGQGFEARKIEHAGLAEKIDEAKTVVEGLGEELKSKLDGSHEGLSELKQLLEGLAASSESFTTVENVKELTELINREFERARGEQDAAKLENEERDAAAVVKHDETKVAIIVELGAKIDEKLGEVIAKYDEAQSLIDTKFTEAAERGNSQLEAVTDTKSLAEDIKLVIGSMGDSVNEACERMSADAKTVLEKVDVSYNKMEEIHNEVKTQQELSRSDVERAAAATERVENKLHEFHPQVLESIQEILSIVGQHYNHAQQTAQDVKMELSVIPAAMTKMLPALPPPEPEKYDDSQVHEKLNNLLEHSKGNQVQETLNTLIERVTNDQVHEKLDQLLGKTTSTNGEIYEKLNELLEHATNSNGPIHEKLDTLIGHATNKEQSVNQMMKLDEMHKDIMETSRKMNEMMVAQSALIAEDTERRRKEAEEAAIALERRTAQREQIEAEILNLKDEKDSMLAMMQRLKTEKDELAAQSAKLHKEVSALETALELRHEEMQVMEERADSLEKRILEGVLDHARTVLLNRPSSVHGLNMKKVRSARGRNVSASSTASTAKDVRSALGNSIGLALKKRAPPASQAGSIVPSTASKERRILSLSHVTGNRGLADRQSGSTGGLANLKRSQSVKSNYSYRKHSWGGRSSVANKENEVFPEEDESGEESDAGTERRTSYTGTYADSMTYGTGSVISTNRQVSTASTRNLESVADEGEEEDQATEKDENEDPHIEDETLEAKKDEPEAHSEQPLEELDEETSKMVLYGHPADSGLGSEITSAAG